MAVTVSFSAQQILEAGRRAEADGNRDYAVRFYRHLTSNFAGTPEAAEAGSSLFRLERTAPPTQPADFARPFVATPLLGPPGANGSAAQLDPRVRTHAPPPPSAVAPPVEAAQPRTSRRKPRPHADDEAAQPKLPRYRFGRFLAALLSVVGAVGALFALGALLAGFLLPASRTANTVAAAVLASPAMAASVALASLVVLLIGLTARAVFTIAMRPPQPVEADDDED